MEKISIPNLEPDVIDAIFNCLYKTSTKETPALLFGTPESRERRSAFLLAHGTPEGNIIINGVERNTKDTLEELISSGLLDATYFTKVYTISCHGGEQLYATNNGVSIESIHNSSDQIDIMIDVNNNILNICIGMPKWERLVRNVWGTIIFPVLNWINNKNKKGIG